MFLIPPTDTRKLQHSCKHLQTEALPETVAKHPSANIDPYFALLPRFLQRYNISPTNLCHEVALVVLSLVTCHTAHTSLRPNFATAISTPSCITQMERLLYWCGFGPPTILSWPCSQSMLHCRVCNSVVSVRFEICSRIPKHSD